MSELTELYDDVHEKAMECLVRGGTGLTDEALIRGFVEHTLDEKTEDAVRWLSEGNPIIQLQLMEAGLRWLTDKPRGVRYGDIDPDVMEKLKNDAISILSVGGSGITDVGLIAGFVQDTLDDDEMRQVVEFAKRSPLVRLQLIEACGMDCDDRYPSLDILFPDED